MPRWARWCLTILVGLFLLAGFALWRMHRQADETLARHTALVEAELAARLARVEERAPLTPWPADRPPSTRIRDARLVYERGLADLAGMSEEEKQVLRTGGDSEEALDEDALATWFAAHGEVLDRLAEARFTDRLSPEPRLADGYKAPGFDFDPPLLVRALLAAHFRLALMRAEDAEALRGVRTALLVGRDGARGGTLLQTLLGTVLGSEALEHLRVLLARGHLDEQALAALADDLATLRPPAPGPALTDLFGREKLLLRRTLLLRADDPDDEFGLGRPFEVSWRHLYSPRLRTAEALDEIDPVPLPLEGREGLTWLEAIRRLEAATPVEPTSPAAALETMFRLVAPRAAQTLGLHAMQHHLAEVAVALTRYRAAHGTWPTALEALVPRYLESLRVCPLSGLPLGYTEGVVWSGGGDGDDDGGRPLSKDDGWNADGDRVWDLIPPTEPGPSPDPP